MPIIIKSKREGFRRCGIAHHLEEITHPDGRFTPDEITRLQAEPRLTVKLVESSVERIVPDQPQEISGDTMTVAQIKNELDALGVEYPDKAKKAELFMLYQAALDTVETIED